MVPSLIGLLVYWFICMIKQDILQITILYHVGSPVDEPHGLPQQQVAWPILRSSSSRSPAALFLSTYPAPSSQMIIEFSTRRRPSYCETDGSFTALIASCSYCRYPPPYPVTSSSQRPGQCSPSHLCSEAGTLQGRGRRPRCEDTFC